MRRVLKSRCPRCGEQMEIEAATGRVERHWPKDKKGPETPDLLTRAAEAQKKAAQDPDMDGLIRKSTERHAKVEDAFGESLKKAQENPEPPPQDVD